MQNLSEDGALLPPVVLGSVLVAVCGQTLQTLTEAFTVLHLELLRGKDGLDVTYARLLLLPRVCHQLTSSISRPSSTSRAMVSPTAIL